MKDLRPHHRYSVKDLQGPSQKKGASVPVLLVLFLFDRRKLDLFFGAVLSGREGTGGAKLDREALGVRTTGGVITIVRPRLVKVHQRSNGPPHAGYSYFCFKHESAGQFGADRR